MSKKSLSDSTVITLLLGLIVPVIMWVIGDMWLYKLTAIVIVALIVILIIIRWERTRDKKWWQKAICSMAIVLFLISISFKPIQNQFLKDNPNKDFELMSLLFKEFLIPFPLWSLLLFSICFICLLILLFTLMKKNRALKKQLTDFLRVTVITTSDNPSEIFIGTWKNEWTGGFEIFEVIDKNKYVMNGKPIFEILDFQYDKEKGTIYFKKQGLGIDSRLFENELKIISLTRFEGEEILNGNRYSISYKRIA
jgi:hypothetical protein